MPKKAATGTKFIMEHVRMVIENKMVGGKIIIANGINGPESRAFGRGNTRQICKGQLL
jgi:hypothetical protein